MPSLTPVEAFEQNISDADRLLLLTRMLLTAREGSEDDDLRESAARAMRADGPAERVSIARSREMLVAFAPNARMTVADLQAPKLRPILRQAVVAIAAAVDTYVSEKACTYVDRDRAEELNLRQRGSANPDAIIARLKEVGSYRKGLFNSVDAQRGCNPGTSREQLKVLAERRNRIAHAGDLRRGGRKAPLRVDTVEMYLHNAREITEALDKLLPSPGASTRHSALLSAPRRLS